MKTLLNKIGRKVLPILGAGIMAIYSGNVFGQLDGPEPKKIISSSEHAQVIFEYEKDSSDVRKALDMFEKFGIFSETKKREIYLSNRLSWLSSPNGSTIMGNFKSFSDSTFEYVLFHENAHCYLTEHHNKLYPIMDELSLRMSGIGGNLGIKAETLGLEALFTESTYIQWEALSKKNISIKSDAGHAGDGPSELFASTSTVLYFFPKEFFEFLAIIEKNNIKYPGYALLAKETARTVVLAYGEKHLFSEEVYEKLGLK